MDKTVLLKRAIRVARFSRLLAKLIDMFIVGVMSVLFYPLGVILAIIYISIADSLQDGQSVGKKVIGFRVVSLEDGSPCSAKQSFIRNLPFTIPVFFSIIPFWGWLMALIIGIPLVILETYLLITLDSGHRLGDVMADTTVMANDDSKEFIKKKKAVSV